MLDYLNVNLDFHISRNPFPGFDAFMLLILLTVSQIVPINPTDVLGEESCVCKNEQCGCGGFTVIKQAGSERMPKLQGEIDDCSCRIENVDSFNNMKVYPILNQLLERDYFRYYKVNMFRPCPFKQASSGQCGSRSCAVDECREDQIPAGLKNNNSHEKNKYLKENQAKENSADTEKCSKNKDHNKLGDLDVTISEEGQEAFQQWKKFDDKLNNFCETDDIESPDAVYYDLVKNPERFTGYTGPSAVNVWKLIYDQNCFQPDVPEYGQYASLGMCLEKRTFFRLISGFHTSINVDVTANWLIPAKTAFDAPQWGPNVDEFVKRFDPKVTFGEGPNRLKNLYFAYLVEMRALAKATPYLLEESFYTGNKKEDEDVRRMVQDLVEILKSFPNHFDESKLFQGSQEKLMDDFKLHFRNISRIMDCVGCDKCRLWGKVQITGMGAALKILFSGDSMHPDSTVTREHRHSKIPFQLVRGEIVALLNAFGRLSKSIHEIETFRNLLNS